MIKCDSYPNTTTCSMFPPPHRLSHSRSLIKTSTATATTYSPIIHQTRLFFPTLSHAFSFKFNFNFNFRVNCSNDEETITSSLSAAYDVLGVSPDCSLPQLKAAFRAKVKKFHPDVVRLGEDKTNSDTIIRQVIRAYEILSKYGRSEIIERECLDPFDEPECEALDIFVNEVLCIGKGCPYSCVKKAPQAFGFSPLSGTAHATSQGHGDDYQVQTAASQCPRNCIHYVTPSQRLILQELLYSIINVPYDTSAERELLYSLIVKAKFENNRYQKPKKQAKSSTKHVDFF